MGESCTMKQQGQGVTAMSDDQTTRDHGDRRDSLTVSRMGEICHDYAIRGAKNFRRAMRQVDF
jgi:hypothetical protein